MEHIMRHMMSGLGIGEGVLWFLIPAAVQWFTLQKTRERCQYLRLAVLAPAVVIFYELFVVIVLLLLGTFLLVLLFAALFQADIPNLLANFPWLLKEILTSEPILNILVRLGLLLAGWGSAWAAFRLKNQGG